MLHLFISNSVDQVSIDVYDLPDRYQLFWATVSSETFFHFRLQTCSDARLALSDIPGVTGIGKHIKIFRIKDLG